MQKPWCSCDKKQGEEKVRPSFPKPSPHKKKEKI